MERMLIGKITKPQGLKGWVRLKLSGADYAMLKGVKTLFLQNEPYKLLKVTDRGDFVVLQFNEITTIEQAEKLRDVKVYLNKSDIVLADDEVLVSELVGYQVITTDGKLVGTVLEVNNYGAGDVYTLEIGNNKTMLFVNANGVIEQVLEKQLVVNENKLKELSV